MDVFARNDREIVVTRPDIANPRYVRVSERIQVDSVVIGNQHVVVDVDPGDGGPFRACRCSVQFGAC